MKKKYKIIFILLSSAISLVLLYLIIFISNNDSNVLVYGEIVSNEIRVDIDDYVDKKAMSDKEIISLKYDEFSRRIQDVLNNLVEVSKSEVTICDKEAKTYCDIVVILCDKKELTSSKVDDIKKYIKNSLGIAQDNISIEFD